MTGGMVKSLCTGVDGSPRNVPMLSAAKFSSSYSAKKGFVRNPQVYTKTLYEDTQLTCYSSIW